jgi:hypothetical protein
VNTSIAKSSLLAEIQFILYPKFYPKQEVNARNVPTQGSENQYDRMLALLAEVLKENEDLL